MNLVDSLAGRDGGALEEVGQVWDSVEDGLSRIELLEVLVVLRIFLSLEELLFFSLHYSSVKIRCIFIRTRFLLLYYTSL